MLEEQFREETGTEKPLSNGMLRTIYLQKYIKWLEKKLLKLRNCDCGQTLSIGLCHICDNDE